MPHPCRAVSFEGANRQELLAVCGVVPLKIGRSVEDERPEIPLSKKKCEKSEVWCRPTRRTVVRHTALTKLIYNNTCYT
jgi:hypothetical protein